MLRPDPTSANRRGQYNPNLYQDDYRPPAYMRRRANSLDSVSTTTTMQSNLPAYKEALREVAAYYAPIRTSFSQNRQAAKVDRTTKVYKNAVDQVSSIYKGAKTEPIPSSRPPTRPPTRLDTPTGTPSSFPQETYQQPKYKRNNFLHTRSSSALLNIKSSFENLLHRTDRKRPSAPRAISMPIQSTMPYPPQSPRAALKGTLPTIVASKTCQDTLWALKAQGCLNATKVECNPSYHVRLGDLPGLKYHLDILHTNPNLTYTSIIGSLEKRLPLIFWIASFAPVMQIMPMLRLLTEHYKAHVARTFGDDIINLLTCAALNRGLFERVSNNKDEPPHHPDFVAVAEWCLTSQSLLPDIYLLKEIVNSGGLIGDLEYIFDNAVMMTIPNAVIGPRRVMSQPGGIVERTALSRKHTETAITSSLIMKDDAELVMYLYKESLSLPPSILATRKLAEGAVARPESSASPTSPRQDSMTAKHLALAVQYRRKESLIRMLNECIEASNPLILQEAIRLTTTVEESGTEGRLNRRVSLIARERRMLTTHLESIQPRRRSSRQPMAMAI